nr:ParB N-terminal domain-containing protein [Methylorubrum extorquens]
MVVEHWPVERLVPYAKNAKKHSKDSTKKLAAAIKGSGRWTQPIVVREDGEIIAGHGRRLAAIELGRKTVPVVVMHGITDAEADALRLSDNRVQHQIYDTDLVREGLTALSDAGLEMDWLGFDEKELSFMTDDLAATLDDAFVDDIAEAVEEQKEENEAAAIAVDEAPQRVAEAFGFSKVTVADSRRVKAFMSRIQTETGKKGAEAFMAFLTEFGI